MLESNLLSVDSGGDLVNNGKLFAGTGMWLNGGNDVTNKGSLISGGLLNIKAGNDLINASDINNAGYIEGVDVALNAGDDIVNRTEFSTSSSVIQLERLSGQMVPILIMLIICSEMES